MSAYADDEPDELDPSMDGERVAALVHLPKHPRGLTRKGRARDVEALRLKALGYSLEEIAAKLSLSDDPRRAAAAIKRALGGVLRFATDEHRALELESYDELEVALWRQLRKSHLLVDRGTIVLDLNGQPLDDDRYALEAIDRIMKIKERRAKLLGLDAPTRSEVISLDSIDAEIARLQEELRYTVEAPEDDVPEGLD